MTHGVTLVLSHSGAERRMDVEKAKDMYQRKIRIPDDVKRAIEVNGEQQSRQFNTELIYQLRKAYGLVGNKDVEA